jgi:hypothetical protein
VRTEGQEQRLEGASAHDAGYDGERETKPTEPKSMVASGVSATHGPPSRLLMKFCETHDMPLPGASTVGVLYRRQ